MKAFFADHVGLQLPAGHRFPFQKYGLLRERVAADLPSLALQAAEPTSEGELALAHEPHYIAAVLQGHLSAQAQREIGFPWSPRMAERACRSVGATISAARVALREGIGANLAGGTHHASAESGGGYCVFNDVAVAARLMQAEWHRLHRRLLRVAVIDLDVHQGNGTASIFRDDPTVFTLSLHGAKNFPFRKQPGDLDVDLPDGCGDVEYLQALDSALDQLWLHHGEHLPGLVFYLAGADPHEGDRLGRLKLSTEGLAERDRRVFAALLQRRIPVALSMAGGYGRDLADTVQVQINTLRLAEEHWQRWNNQRP
ncbi:histone deacetylase [Rhizobacter sp. J219]|uniref:histone deacetylase family protein n=1 Tax=Rhizobacter sp. J219 TaxID=2898430 RepID=UPI0021509D18|nr:histone deacetylase [Rhizobacter sp. J219]MCR5882747.1 histone deacetylase [Rhizobacter sp. J219]